MIRHDDSCRTRISGMYSCTCGAYERAQKVHESEQRQKEQIGIDIGNMIKDVTDINPGYPGAVTDIEDNSPEIYPEFNQNKIGTLEDKVHYPPHYRKHPSGIECIQITEHFNFNKGNAIKYIWRSDLKNGIEDLQKAKWYINREIERIKNENQTRSGLQDNGPSEAKGNS